MLETGPATLAPAPEVELSSTLSGGWGGKRVLDICLCSLMLVAAAPLLLMVSLLVKLTSPGPVFFRHKRIGRGGVDFMMLKFRTMRTDAEVELQTDQELLRLYYNSDHKIPLRLDPRVTKVGRILRSTSIDELPQLLNILKGEMSLVGPRPVVFTQLAEYGDRVVFYYAVRPGLTGLWQVSGRSTVKFPKRAELDANYCRNCSLMTDLKIILGTPIALIRGLNAD